MSNLQLNRPTEHQILLTLQDFLLAKRVARLSPRTLEFYERRVGRFIQFIPVNRVQEVTSRHIRLFLSHLFDTGISDATVHGYARAIRAFLYFCKREGYIDQVPTLDMPKVVEKHKPVLSKEEFRRLLGASQSHRDTALVMFLADTGLRASECLSLNWGDIDLTRGIVRVRRTKNKKWRSVIVGASTTRKLLRYRQSVDHSPRSPLWVSNRGTRLKQAGLRMVFLRLSLRAEVKASPHDMRRLFATWSIREGMSLFAVQGILGHSSLEMVRKYAELIEDDLVDQHKLYGPMDNLFH